MMLLPQRPYIPVGTLQGAVVYPAVEGAYDDAAIAEALQAARLPQFVERLHEEGFWAQSLSLGEQQRLAIARALLAKPDWLFLDEATAALDEPTEAEIYRMLRERLPGTTIVSIGHRSTLQAFHERRIDMRPADESGPVQPPSRRAARRSRRATVKALAPRPLTESQSGARTCSSPFWLFTTRCRPRRYPTATAVRRATRKACSKSPSRPCRRASWSTRSVRRRSAAAAADRQSPRRRCSRRSRCARNWSLMVKDGRSRP